MYFIPFRINDDLMDKGVQELLLFDERELIEHCYEFVEVYDSIESSKCFSSA